MKTAYEVWSAPRGPVANGPVVVTWGVSAAHADDEPWVCLNCGQAGHDGLPCLPGRVAEKRASDLRHLAAKPVWNAAAKQREALLHGDWRNVMAKAWGNARGYKANKGSWIENEFGNSTGCQGWSSFYRKFYCKIWKSIQEEVK